MELAFVKAINPTQDNLPFYDTTFKPIMTKCDGNVDATFANALGYDSFPTISSGVLETSSAIWKIHKRNWYLFWS